MTDTKDSTCLLKAPASVSCDQRQWTRFKPEQTDSFLLFEDERIAVEVVDESFDGVGVLVKQQVEVEAGDSVELVYYGLPIRGVVRSLTPQGRHTRLGIQWVERLRTSDARRRRCRTESDYFLFGGLPVACRVVDQTGSTLIALLPDRTEIEIAPDDICSISRFQRLADLEGSDEQLRLLAAVYQLGTIQSPEDALREVLNLEFASSWD